MGVIEASESCGLSGVSQCWARIYLPPQSISPPISPWRAHSTILKICKSAQTPESGLIGAGPIGPPRKAWCRHRGREETRETLKRSAVPAAPPPHQMSSRWMSSRWMSSRWMASRWMASRWMASRRMASRWIASRPNSHFRVIRWVQTTKTYG